MTTRQMALTPDLVSRVHRDVRDGGPEPGLAYHTDEDYQAAVRKILSSHRDGDPVWLFAYGSLIWKPEIEHGEERPGTARGWHRAFCFRVTRFRGTPEQPGLMMALDRGGQCRGVLYRLSGEPLPAQLEKLFRREFTVKPPNSMPRWIVVDAEGERINAIAFVMNRRARAYCGKLSPEETADILAKACGHWGSGAEYLMNTVAQLEARGIHDRHLWLLQELVAARIAP